MREKPIHPPAIPANHMEQFETTDPYLDHRSGRIQYTEGPQTSYPVPMTQLPTPHGNSSSFENTHQALSSVFKPDSGVEHPGNRTAKIILLIRIFEILKYQKIET